MLIIREVFTAKPGQASKLAKLFRRAFLPAANVRVMTDYIGQYNTVVVEFPVQKLSEFEKQMDDYKAGKPDPLVDPKVMEEMSSYTEMYMSGRREIYQVVE